MIGEIKKQCLNINVLQSYHNIPYILYINTKRLENQHYTEKDEK